MTLVAANSRQNRLDPGQPDWDGGKTMTSFSGSRDS